MFKTFVTVSVPIVRPAILLSMLLASVLAIGIYSIPAIVGSTAKIPTLSVHLVRLLNGEFPPRIDQAAVISLFLIAIFGTFWIVQQRLNAFARHAQIGGQGSRSANILLSRPAVIIARTAMIAYIGVISVCPILALLLVALQPYWTPDVDLTVLSFDNFVPLLQDLQSRAAIVNSLMLGIVGSLVTLFVAAVVMVYAISRGGAHERTFGVLTKLPAALSHLVIAAGNHDRLRRGAAVSGQFHRDPRACLFRALHPQGVDRGRGGIPTGRTAARAKRRAFREQAAHARCARISCR